MLKKFILVVAPAFLLSCTCATPLVVSEIQKTDKKLSCKEVILEINEAEHYKELAKKEQGIGFGEMLMPVCWVSSYTKATQASKAAEARVEYLGRIYDVMDCGGKSDAGEKAAAPVAPPFIQVQPVPAPAPVIKKSSQQPFIAPAAEDKQPVMDRTVIQNKPDAEKDTVDKVEEQVPGEPDIDDQMVRNNTHQHVDKSGKVYTHSHPHAGSHKHLD